MLPERLHILGQDVSIVEDECDKRALSQHYARALEEKVVSTQQLRIAKCNVAT